MWTRQQIAQTIDHAVLKPVNTDQDVIEACRLAREYGLASVCVRPTDVPLAAAELQGSVVVPSTVIGFPHGIQRPEAKALEARLAIADGARELDMVMNSGRFLSGDHEFVRREIAGVVAEAHPQGVLVKVILETCQLTPEQIAVACRLAQAGGADFVKTSTGFAEKGATPEAVRVMLETVGGALGVKASGGIRNYEQAVLYLDMGCKRLGTTGTVAILDGASGGHVAQPSGAGSGGRDRLAGDTY
jgi:deoxyribose-phosphate aldolase